jgi:hypothetical protein
MPSTADCGSVGRTKFDPQAACSYLGSSGSNAVASGWGFHRLSYILAVALDNHTNLVNKESLEKGHDIFKVFSISLSFFMHTAIALNTSLPLPFYH